MNFIYKFLPERIIESLGWTLVHSIWQGAIIALLLGFVLLITNKFTSGTRYLIAVAALVLVITGSAFTFVKTYLNYDEVQISAFETRVWQDNEESVTPVVPVLSEPEIVNDKVELKFQVQNFKNYFYTNFPLIVTLWLLGMLIFMLKFLGGLAYTQRIKHYRISAVEQEWEKRFNSLLHQLGIKKAVKFLQSTLVKVPVVIGYFKPVVLVPLSAFTGLTTQQMESVLVHELAHIIRRDYLINLIQSLAEILFFYHPAVWWISKTIKEEREHCCDDIALEHTGDSLNFVKALAGIQEQMLHSEGLAMALSGNNNKLLKRIQRLINQPKMKTNFIEGFTASCLIFLGIFILLLNSNAASSFSVMSTLSDRNFANESSMPGFSEPNAVFPQDTLLTKKEEKKRKEAKIKAEKEQKSAELEQKQAEIEQKQAEQEKQKAEFNEQRARLEKERAERDAERAEREAERAERDIERAELEQLRMERQLESEEAMDELADEIARGVQEGLQEMDLDVIVDETMTGIEAGLNEIDFNGIVQEALNGINEGVANMDFNLIVDEVVSGVKATLIEMDLNSIVNEVTMEVKNAMQDMNTNKSTNTGVTVRETNISENPFIGNSAHLEILNRGVAAWNTWRKNNQDIIPDLSGAVLTAYNLRDINFYKATLVFADFKEVSFDFADLRKANLEGANCKEASFFEAKLQEANFTGANLKEVDLSGMDLRKTCFAYANLKEATLAHANLQGAIFKGANLKEANLYKTDFRNADLSDVDYSEAQVEGADFSGALYNSTTFFPSGFNPDAHGMKKN